MCAFLGLQGRVNEHAVPPLSQESTAAMEIPQAGTETETEKEVELDLTRPLELNISLL